MTIEIGKNLSDAITAVVFGFLGVAYFWAITRHH